MGCQITGSPSYMCVKGISFEADYKTLYRKKYRFLKSWNFYKNSEMKTFIKNVPKRQEIRWEQTLNTQQSKAILFLLFVKEFLQFQKRYFYFRSSPTNLGKGTINLNFIWSYTRILSALSSENAKLYLNVCVQSAIFWSPARECEAHHEKWVA